MSHDSIREVELTQALRAELASVPLLATLERDALDEGLAHCPVREVGPAVRIISEGEYDDRFFVLVSGRCEVTLKKKSDPYGTVSNVVRGREAAGTLNTAHSVGSLNSGDFFGEMSCMSPWPRSSTVMTTSKSVVLEVGADVFEDWMEASAGFRDIMEEAYMTRGLMSLLRGISAFAVLGDAALASLLHGATIKSFKRGQHIVTQGEDGDALYVIRGGVVAITRRVKDKEEDITVSYMRAGSYFGEMALLDGQPRNATVTATSKTEVVRIDRDRFMAVVERFPRAAEQLRRTVNERLQAGEAVLGSEGMSDALSFMAGQGILEGTDVLVVELDKCIYCGNCESACASSHDVSLISLHGPTHKAFLFPTACRNCNDPLCLLKCPVDAITRDRAGEVKIADHCIGCSGCAVNCPYDTISMRPISEEQGERAREAAGFKKPVTRQAIKCDLCEDIPTGPQCVQSCPTRAILRLRPKQLVREILKSS